MRRNCRVASPLNRWRATTKIEQVMRTMNVQILLHRPIIELRQQWITPGIGNGWLKSWRITKSAGWPIGISSSTVNRWLWKAKIANGSSLKSMRQVIIRRKTLLYINYNCNNNYYIVYPKRNAIDSLQLLSINNRIPTISQPIRGRRMQAAPPSIRRHRRLLPRFNLRPIHRPHMPKRNRPAQMTAAINRTPEAPRNGNARSCLSPSLSEELLL